MNESKRIVFLDYVRVFACFLGYLVMARIISVNTLTGAHVRR